MRNRSSAIDFNYMDNPVINKQRELSENLENQVWSIYGMMVYLKLTENKEMRFRWQDGFKIHPFFYEDESPQIVDSKARTDKYVIKNMNAHDCFKDLVIKEDGRIFEAISEANFYIKEKLEVLSTKLTYFDNINKAQIEVTEELDKFLNELKGRT